MSYYVVGFMFNPGFYRVALIRKQKPAWQAWLLNGIGGKVEGTETFPHAMAREFEEEAGLATSPSDWNWFCALNGKNNDGEVFVLKAFWSVGDLSLLKSVTDEQIEIIYLSGQAGLMRGDMVENVKWLLPLAFDCANGGYPPSRVEAVYEGAE